MRYIEAPTEFVPTEAETTLFLAGGITGCEN